MRFNLLFRIRWWLVYFPVLLAAALLIWASFTHWAPLPPRSLVIAAGNPEGGYSEFARRYAARLERTEVQTRLVFNDGWVGISDRFAQTENEAQVGFVQGMYSHKLASNVQTLGTVSREPLWVVSRLPALVNVSQFKGLRLAVGAPNTSSHAAALLALEAHGIQPSDVTLDPVQGVAALNALIEGRVDVVMQLLAIQTQAVQIALQTPGLQFIGMTRADEIRLREPRLRLMVLPQGAVELRGNIPPKDLALLATETHLVLRENLHPALHRLLLRIAVEVHELPSLLQRDREYPSLSPVDVPLSSQARSKAALRPGLESLLPYWWAQLAHVLLVYVLPIVVAAALLLAWIPRWFDWRVNAALLHYYGELRYLDDEVSQLAAEQPIALKGLLERIDAIEQTVAHLELPNAYAERWYTLRAHLAQARERLLDLRAR